MKLYNIFNEDWKTVRGYDKERYDDIPGLEGPFSTKSGKVLYYDPKAGKYYDRDVDMYLDDEEAMSLMNESKLFDDDGNVIATNKKTQRIMNQIRANNPQAKTDLEALLLAFEKGQTQDRTDINTLYGQNAEEEADIERHERQLARMRNIRSELDEAPMDPERKKALDAAMANLEKQFGGELKRLKPISQSAEELAKRRKEREQETMKKAKARAEMLMKLADEHGEKINASEVGYFAKGISDGKSGYIDRRASDAYGPNVYAYDAGVRVGQKLAMSESEYPRVISATPAQMADPEIQALFKQAAALDALERGNDGTYAPSTAGVVKRAGKPGNPMFGAGILKPAKDIKNEDYYETDEHRELARLGRIIMDMGAKRDDDVGTAMGAVGNELTKYGTPQGVSTIKKLEQVTGQPESVIMKMMALAQKVQGDVAVGDDVPDEIDEAPSTSDDAYFNQDNPSPVKKINKPSQPLIKNPVWGQPGHEPMINQGPDQELVTKADKLKNIPFIGDRAASAFAQGVAQDSRASQATKTAVAKTAAGTTPVTIPRIKGQPIDRTTKGLKKTQKGQMPMQNPDDRMAMGPDTVAKKLPKERVPRGADPLKIFNPKDKPAPAPKKQDDTTFAQAFRAARKAHGGPGGAFMWRGKKYQTNVKGEKYVKNPVLVQSKQYEDKSWSEVNKELGDKYGDDVGMNWNPKAPSLSGAAHTTYKYLTQPRSGDKSGQMKRNEVTESDWEENFIKRLKAKISGSPEVQAYLDLKAKQYGDQNLDLDPGAAEKGLAIGVLDTAKARRKASKKGVRAPGSLRASPNTRNPERLPEAESPMVTYTVPNVTFDMAQKLEKLAKEKGVEYSRQGRTVVLKGPRIDITSIRTKMGIAQTNIPMEPIAEALDHDIKIGDTVETKKMGQMQGTVTGFSTKYGDTRVMFKHKSGKVYATPASNLKVIDSKKSESLDNVVVEAGTNQGQQPNRLGYYKNPSVDYQPNPGVKPSPEMQAKIDAHNARVAREKAKGPRPTGPDNPGWTQYTRDIGQGYTSTVGPGTRGKELIKNKQGDVVGTKTTLTPDLTTTKNTQDWAGGKAGTTTNRFSAGGVGVTQTTDTKTGKQLSKIGSYTIPGKGTTTKPIESIEEAKKKPVPTDPSKWSYYKNQAKKKFDVYPSAYANAWAAKQYKAAGGGWRMGKPKK